MGKGGPPFLGGLTVGQEGSKPSPTSRKRGYCWVSGTGVGSGPSCRRSCRSSVLSMLPSILPPLLSMLPSILSTFDAPLVAGAGGEKRASRRGYQSEREQSCDRLSGNRGVGVFHTIEF